MNKKNLNTLLLVLGVALTNAASAEDRIDLAPGVMYFDYEETGDNGSFLDGETGPVLGATVTYKHDFNPAFTGLFTGGIYTGTVNYDGHTQAGFPVQTDTQADFFTLGFAVEFPVPDYRDELSIIAGYRFRRWERDIQSIGSVSGLYEVYQWQELALGANFYPGHKNKGPWSFFAGLFRTWNAEIKIDLTSDGYGRPALSLGSETGVELAAQWMAMVEHHQNYGFRLSYKTWGFGRSPSEVSSGPSGSVIVHEPESKTSNILFELVITIPN